ncbi:TPA: carbohydrate ABC transporter substrate-binding protein [bacterium]|nr:carbohydrate ABC transporter substrate-binding protein [bacterium]
MKKRIIAVLMSFVAVLTLSACTETVVELNTVSMFGGTDANRVVYESTIYAFENEHNIRVKDKSQSSDEEWKSTVISNFNTGNEPDVLQFFTGETAKPFVDAGLVMSIEDIRKEYPDYAKNIDDSVLGTHSVPTTGFVEGIFVNLDHFKSNEAKAYLDKDVWTWDEFKALCAKLVEDNADVEGYKPIAYGQNIPHYWIDHLVAAQLGPDYYNVIKGAEGEDKLTNALLKLSEIKDYLSYDETEEFSSQAFLDGKYTFQLDGSWFGGRIELENITVYPFPVVNEEYGSPLLSGFTSGFYITKKAWDNPKKRDLAVKFVEAMTSRETLTKFVTYGGGFAADSEAKPQNETKVQEALRLVSPRADFVVLPLGDASVAGTYAGLVEVQASFVNNQADTAKAAVKTYIEGQTD